MLQNLAVHKDVIFVINAMFGGYLLCAGGILFWLLDKKTRYVLMVLLGIAAASVGQLLIIHPIGPRCLYLTYVLAVVVILYLLPDMGQTDNRKLRMLFRGLGVLGCGVYGVLLALHMQAWKVHTVRVDYANAQLAEGKTQIEIIMLPYTPMFQCPDDSYVYPYKFNLGDMNAMSFQYITYDDYLGRMK
jgi:hypothetical protein